MNDEIKNLFAALDKFKGGFNKTNCHNFHAYGELLEVLEKLKKALLLRMKFAKHNYFMLNKLKYEYIFYKEEEAHDSDCFDHNGMLIEYRCKKEFEFFINIFADGIFSNLASVLDILSHISNYLFYDIRGFVQFNNLLIECNKSPSPNRYESLILDNYQIVRNSKVVGNSTRTWINDFKSLRNDLTHEAIIFPGNKELRWHVDDAGDSSELYYRIPSSYFQKLGLAKNLDFKEYCGLLYNKMEYFMEDCFKNIGLLLNPRMKFPAK